MPAAGDVIEPNTHERPDMPKHTHPSSQPNRNPYVDLTVGELVSIGDTAHDDCLRAGTPAEFEVCLRGFEAIVAELVRRQQS